MPSAPSASPKATPPNLRAAENALARLGFSKIPPLVAEVPSPEFWVQEAGVPRRVFPVFVEPGAERERSGRYVSWAAAKTDAAVARAIVVVPSDDAARETWQRVRAAPNGRVETELAILVIPESPGPAAPHWHRGLVPRRELLRLTTGIAVGLYYRAQASEGSAQVDFGEMLEILRSRLGRVALLCEEEI
ncbi:MAG: hypothetical protein L3J93_06390, partial [Thermoplasmata archaeon]|nr:hypothetical protein [Thermoplasmata archaeon]